MTKRELQRLSRADLLELLVAQVKENEELRERLAEAQEQLADKQIKIQQAGSIAEAAIQINRVFEAAQLAADQYLENVHRLVREQRP